MSSKFCKLENFLRKFALLAPSASLARGVGRQFPVDSAKGPKFVSRDQNPYRAIEEGVIILTLKALDRQNNDTTGRSGFSLVVPYLCRISVLAGTYQEDSGQTDIGVSVK